jgi:CHAT domain-containing protein
MMNRFDISYTYSATLQGETMKRKLNANNNVIAFAPEYLNDLKIENILHSRQQNDDILADLPFARSEADYICRLLKGKLYSDKAAIKSIFRAEAAKYGILHLSMHAIINDDDPMYSTLVFSHDSSGIDDRFLRTFEIYGIPLKARMVMLSSCNTGVGKFYSGEGIFSLARGFVFAGSESVVMSMWKIDDRSGSDIVKLYYDYLKKGYSKSLSLKRARIDFLNSADQLRSHPYFWGSLTVYGVNDALFRSRTTVAIAILLIIIAAGACYYFYRL